MSVVNQPPNTTTASGIRITPFGAIEAPRLPQTLPTDKIVYRVDTLDCLRDMWGENILMARQRLYEIVSGTVDDKTLRSLLTSYYKRYSAFANYVDNCYFFGEHNTPLVSRIIAPARKAIGEYSVWTRTVNEQRGGTYLGTHQDYVYFSYRKPDLLDLKKGVRLC